jgi:hypothetical protein
MAEFKYKVNSRTGQFNLVPTNVVLSFKEGVVTQANLPLTGNAKGDARITNDSGHLYVWSLEASSGLLTDWVDAGDIVDLKWDSINGKPLSVPANIDDSVNKIVKPFEVVATSIETDTITIGTGTIGDGTVIAEETFSLVSDEGNWNIYVDNTSILVCVHVDPSVFPVDSIPLYRVEFANHGAMHFITTTDVRCFYNLPTIPLNGVVDPTAITPDYIGQVYINTAPDSGHTGFFFACGISVGNWTEL